MVLRVPAKGATHAPAAGAVTTKEGCRHELPVPSTMHHKQANRPGHAKVPDLTGGHQHKQSSHGARLQATKLCSATDLSTKVMSPAQSQP